MPVLYTEGASSTTPTNLGRVRLTVTTPAGTPSPTFVRHERAPAGEDWHPVRGYEKVPTSGGATTTAYDYEPLPGDITSYRWKSGYTTAAGEDILSEPSLVVAVEYITDVWRWKVMEDPAQNLIVTPIAEGDTLGLTRTKTAQQAEFIVLGDPFAVDVFGRAQDHRFPVTFYFASEADMRSWEALRELWRTGLLEAPDQHWYGTIGPTLAIRENGRQRFVDVEFRERRKP